MAATSFLFLLLFLSLGPHRALSAAAASPYLYPATFFKNYERMLTSFKIFIYTPNNPIAFTAPPASLFYDSLLRSRFVTADADEAHLFFVPFSPDASTRSLARLVRELRGNFPYWNRTLGADHFFVHPTGFDFTADRNVLELKKNSVQISVFPTISGYFIPHKDVTLPPVSPRALTLHHAPPGEEPPSFLGYLRWDGETESVMVNELKLDDEFAVESQPSDDLGGGGGVQSSKFCLFLYGADVAWLPAAMASGCVPVIIVDRPIQDLPLMDVLRWSEMAILVGSTRGAAGLKELLRGVKEEDYERMRGLCVAAAQHLMWNSEAKPYDAFHMLIYQLWLRRHTIRYARREM
nr:probable glycosyltransferase At5g03795 [Ipomoea trifida]